VRRYPVASSSESPVLLLAAPSPVPAKRSSESTVPKEVPAKFYPNSDTCKEKILDENQNKSGIYM
jgi:hypothetical protein